MATLKNIYKTTQKQFETLLDGEPIITPDGEHTYDPDGIYLVEQDDVHLYKYTISLFLDGETDNYFVIFEMFSNKLLSIDIDVIRNYIAKHTPNYFTNAIGVPCRGRGELSSGDMVDIQYLYCDQGKTICAKAYDLCANSATFITENNPVIDAWCSVQIF